MTPENAPRLTIRRKDLLYFSLFLVLFLAAFREFFFTSRVFYERDTTVVEIPARRLTVDLLRQGNLALWTDAYGNGQPFLANPKNAVLYPATLLYLILPLFTAFKLFYLIHVVLGWIGLYVLAKSYRLSERAAFLAASLFSFSGMYLSSFEFYNHVAALAWMPWILLAIGGIWKGRRWTRVTAGAVLWALMILAGAPEIALLTAMLAAGQAFFFKGEWKKQLARLGATLLAGCLLSAAQLLPSLELLRQTGREAQLADWPLELVQLANVPFPHILGNDREPGLTDYWGWHLFDKDFPLYYSLYMGFGALVLALFALKRPVDRRRRGLLILGGVLFLLSCGSYSPFFFLHKVIPVLSSVRYPVKFFLGSTFCLCLLAGLGLDDLAAHRAPGRKGLRVLALVALASSALFWAFKGGLIALLNKLMVIDQERSLAELGFSIATGLTLLVVFSMITIIHARAKSPTPGGILLWAVLALAVLDPAYHNRFVNPTVPESFFDRPKLVEDLGPPVVIYRSEVFAPFFKETLGDNVRLLRYFRESLVPFTAMADRVRYVLNWDFYGTYAAAFRDKVDAVKALPPQDEIKILRSLGCQYYIGSDPLFDKAGAGELTIEGVPVAVEKIGPPAASPHLAAEVHRAGTLNEKIAALTDAAFDPADQVVLYGSLGIDPAFVQPRGLGSGKIEVIREISGAGTYSVTTPGEAVAVFPGNYASGWRAWIDGTKTGIFEANLFAKGVVVPAGNHNVVLRYLPGSFRIGAVVSLATLALMIIWCAALGFLARRKARPAAV